MVYQGSKNRICKYIIPIIQSLIDNNNIKTYIEPFVGGGNVIDKVRCDEKIGMDINSDLIDLLNYVKEDNQLLIAPDDCSFEHYKDVRKDVNHEKYSKTYRALIGYMASYGGRYFDGGYGRDVKGGRCVYEERIKNLKIQSKYLSDVKFICKDYECINTNDYHNVMFYIDPPYNGTKKYGKYHIDYDYFHEFCRRLSKDNIVLISEYNMPDDFVCVWSKNIKTMQKSNRIKGHNAVEKLFIHKDQEYLLHK